MPRARRRRHGRSATGLYKTPIRRVRTVTMTDAEQDKLLLRREQAVADRPVAKDTDGMDQR